MTKSYSNDFRKRVIEYLDYGRNYEEVSKLFKEVIRVIGRWYGRYKEEGHYQEKLEVAQKRK